MNTYIIFISSVEDPDTVASAYAAGANGYLTKPIIPVEFMCQVQSMLKQSALSTHLKDTSAKARAAAKSSMLQSERLHLLIKFVQETASANSFSTIAEITFNLMESLGMAGSLMFHIADQHIYFANDGKERDYERKLMTALWTKVIANQSHPSRFFSSKGRVAASFDNCSLFIRGVTEGREESLLDFVGLLMNQLEKSIEKTRIAQQSTLMLSQTNQAIAEVNEALRRVNTTVDTHRLTPYENIRTEIIKHMKEISENLSALNLGKHQNPQARNNPTPK